MNIRYEPCRHCGTMRDPDLRLPCPLCDSRQYPLIGYSYAHEARAMAVLGIGIGVVLLLAILVGAVVFIATINDLRADVLDATLVRVLLQGRIF